MGDNETPKHDAEPSAAMPKSVLLVEDNFIIALDTEDMLRQLGVQQIWTAVNKAEALDIANKHAPEFALLDVNLGEEKGFEVAARLRQLGIPFAFGTGYGDQRAFPDGYTDTPVVSKPYRPETLASALSTFASRRGT